MALLILRSINFILTALIIFRAKTQDYHKEVFHILVLCQYEEITKSLFILGLTPIFHKATRIILPFFFSPPLLSIIPAILCGTLQPCLKMVSLWFPLFSGDTFQ